MPRSKATHGHGSQLFIDTGSGFARVAQIDDIPELPTSSERELYEKSNFDTEEYKDWAKLPLKDGTPITIRGNYEINSASDAILQAADDADEALPYQIIIKEGSDTFEVTGTALFYNLKRMNPADAKRIFQITMKPVDRAGIDTYTPPEPDPDPEPEPEG